MATITSEAMNDRDVDYSSYEYQHIQFTVSLQGGDESGAVTIAQEVDPLESVGGLSTNEVAELVAFRRQVYFDIDGHEQASNDSPSSIEYRGAFGVGLDDESDLVASQSSLGAGSAKVLEQDGTDTVTTDIFENTKNEIFDHVGAVYEPSYENLTDGTGGAGGATNTELEREVNFRSMLGAGPVLDANDSLSAVQRLIKNQHKLDDTSVQMRLTLIWDVAEVDDAGRRFGIPM